MIKLSISNIAWSAENDLQAYDLMRSHGYSGLEIAPTRIFPDNPYDSIEQAAQWAERLQADWGFSLPSMQSIWYGRPERLFASAEEREILAEYTKKAILFAEAIHCNNLVFGCPRNRTLPEGADVQLAVSFFRDLGEYALSHNTVIAMEANPPIYNTNYINTTPSAIELIKQVDSMGFLLNLDVGTMIENGESVSDLAGYVKYINHVHISEPGLKPICTRELHKELFSLLQKENYQGFVSIEISKQQDMDILKQALTYVREISL